MKYLFDLVAELPAKTSPAGGTELIAWGLGDGASLLPLTPIKYRLFYLGSGAAHGPLLDQHLCGIHVGLYSPGYLTPPKALGAPLRSV